MTDLVYRFAHARYGRRVVAGKGVSGNRPALQMSKSKGTRLFLIGVDGLKANLLQRLAHGRSIRFSNTLSEEWFEQLDTRNNHGFRAAAGLIAGMAARGAF